MGIKDYKNFERIEKIQNKDNLLVCFGDSWTWGDSLTDNLKNYNLGDNFWLNSDHDKNKRKNLCFGNSLSDMLNADWINIAYPGESNYWIWQQFKDFFKQINNYNYKKVYIVIVLTETGREINEYKSLISKHKTCEDLMRSIELDIIKKIYEVYSGDIKNIILARNFTVNYNSSKYHTDDLINWVTLNAKHENIINEDLKITGPVTGIALNPIKENCKSLNYKPFFISQVKKLEILHNYLDQSKLHSRKSTKHPTAESHQLWAEYLFKYFNNKQ